MADRGTVTGRFIRGPELQHLHDYPKVVNFHKQAQALVEMDLAAVERRILAILPKEAHDACKSNTPGFFEPSQPQAANVRQKKRAFIPIYGPRDKSGHRRVVGVREINPNSKPK